jgi:predicted nucleic acid-binding protein
VLRVTADSNIFISGLNFAGIPRQILNLAESGAIHLAVSDNILKIHVEAGRQRSLNRAQHAYRKRDQRDYQLQRSVHGDAGQAEGQ